MGTRHIDAIWLYAAGKRHVKCRGDGGARAHDTNDWRGFIRRKSGEAKHSLFARLDQDASRRGG